MGGRVGPVEKPLTSANDQPALVGGDGEGHLPTWRAPVALALASTSASWGHARTPWRTWGTALQGREEMGVKRWKISSKMYWSCLRYAWCSEGGPKVWVACLCAHLPLQEKQSLPHHPSALGGKSILPKPHC